MVTFWGVIMFTLLITQTQRSSGWSLNGIKDSVTSAFQKTTCTVAGYCCNSHYIPGDIEGLERDLQKNLYGQHIVIDTLINALKDHWLRSVSQKALTLSFHGPPGCGKNYVANYIKKNLFLDGRFIHTFNGRLLFSKVTHVEEYKDNLRSWIRGNMSYCNKQLFIFDEVDKMIPGVLDVIKPIIDYNMIVDNMDYRNVIFVFMSNTGAERIIEQTLRYWNDAKIKREDLTLEHFEDLILQGAFNEKGGFQYCDNIRSNLIDHYIPFLPLEAEHVRKCILDEFHKRGVRKPKEEHIKILMDNIQWGPNSSQGSYKQYSNTGCKRLSQKVGVQVSKYYFTGHTEL